MEKNNFDKLKEFIELAKSEGCFELKYEADGEKFAIQLGGNSPLISTNTVPVTNIVAASGVSQEIPKDDHIAVKSPFVGTFYNAASPETAEYVKIGDQVKAGTTLCIIEAMKIMNEIESDITGEIVELCVANESFVEYGQVLFKIKKN